MKVDRLDKIFLISLFFFISAIASYHVWGIKGVPVWNIIWVSGHHFIIILMALYIWAFTHSKIVRNICLYSVIPYFSFKIFYLVVNKLSLFYLSEYWCSVVCIGVILIALIFIKYGGKS